MSLSPSDTTRGKITEFQESICVQYMLAKKFAGVGDPSSPHIRFSKEKINEMQGKAANEKAYVGFIQMKISC